MTNKATADRLQDREFLTTGDVAELTGWTIGKVRRLCDCGKLPAIDTSTGKRPRWTIRRSDLESFLTPSSVAKVKRPSSRRRIDADVPRVF